MSLNTAHANSGVLIHYGECILIYCDSVNVEFIGQDRQEFKGKKTGRLYLTSHRMIFNNKNMKDQLLSFSFPFITLSEVELEQPIFGANYIKGKVRAQPNGGWVGEAKFKLHFNSGGAIEFGQAMLKAADLASRNSGGSQYDAPPPYSPPVGDFYAAPPPAYAPPMGGYYGWLPPQHVFPNQPAANSIYMTDMPPPYPGLPSYNTATNGYNMHPQQNFGYPPQQNAGYPPQQNAGYPPQQNAGYPPQQNAGYPPQQNFGFGAANQNGSAYPPQTNPQGPGVGFASVQGSSSATASAPPMPSAPPASGSANAKASEAAQCGYYDPNNPQIAYIPPSAHEFPPSYDDATKKDK